MQSEPNVDPRGRPLLPTPEEIEAWAARERARREAWLAGPSPEEKQVWARRFRWRAKLGLEETRLAPTEEDVERWAERERRRRTTWLEGPSDAEKQGWLARQRCACAAAGKAEPTAGDAEAWAEREKQLRRAWAAGPSENEKQRWAEPHAGGVLGEMLRWPSEWESELPQAAREVLREAELAGKGAVHSLARAPLAVWSYLVRAGRTFEEGSHDEPRRRRVPF